MASGQARARLAITGLSDAARQALSQATARDARVAVIGEERLRPALAGFGYDGSINMTADEARRLGAALGCDFFITGRAEVVARSERAGQSHHEALVAVMLVDGRTGALAGFDLIAERADSVDTASARALRTLEARAGGYVDRLLAFRAGRQTPPAPPGDETIEDLPDENSPRAVGFPPPEFLNRVKPEYTAQAESCDVSATVEAAAVFRANGEIGEVVMTRWAGFGLDEAAERAIRQLKFKPATRDGRPVSVRATVRYNFRRVAAPPAMEKPAAPQAPVPDLRPYFRPRIRPPGN